MEYSEEECDRRDLAATIEEYDRQELAATNRELAALSHAPPYVRAERKAEFVWALTHPELVADRIRWIENGDYGRGAQILGRQLKKRGLGLYPLIGQLEWKCSAIDARRAYIESY